MSKRKPYQRQVEPNWWLKNLFFTKYMLREGSCIFITWYSLTLAWGVFRLSQGEAAFNAWLSALQHPISILFHLIALAFAIYHSITWFSLAPKALDIWVNHKPIPDKLIVLGHYIGFTALAIIMLMLVML